MMWQYDLAIECCATCQPWMTRRPTIVPTSKPTDAPVASNATDEYDDMRSLRVVVIEPGRVDAAATTWMVRALRRLLSR